MEDLDIILANIILTFQLQSKYPMLYSILQNEASPELKQRIDRDRNKTTYQVDYCESG